MPTISDAIISSTNSTSLGDRITSTLIGRFAFNLAIFYDAASHRVSRSESIGVGRFGSYNGIRFLVLTAAPRQALHAPNGLALTIAGQCWTVFLMY